MSDVTHGACIVTHAGAANRLEVTDGCVAACEAGRRALAEGGSALDAAVAAVVVLEDDPRMNAGTGSVLRLDGKTIQLDAAVMDASGFGAVAAVENVRNPVHLARAVYDLPHLLLVGEGAEALADHLRLPRGSVLTDEARQKHEMRKARFPDDTFWKGHDTTDVLKLAMRQNDACDTVGAVVRDARGNFAAAGSTGGIWCALKGRVGDTPIPGAGLYVGECGAVVATGIGEVIWRENASRAVHDAMARGLKAKEAIEEVLAAIATRHPGVHLGLLAVGRDSQAGAGLGPLPHATWEAAST